MCQKRRLIYRVTLDDEKSGSLNLPSLISTWKGCFIKFITTTYPRDSNLWVQGYGHAASE